MSADTNVQTGRENEEDFLPWRVQLNLRSRRGRGRGGGDSGGEVVDGVFQN